RKSFPCGNAAAHLVSSYLYCVAARTQHAKPRHRKNAFKPARLAHAAWTSPAITARTLAFRFWNWKANRRTWNNACSRLPGKSKRCSCGSAVEVSRNQMRRRVDTVGELQSQTGQGFTMALPTMSSRERKQGFLSFHDQLLRTNLLPVPN